MKTLIVLTMFANGHAYPIKAYDTMEQCNAANKRVVVTDRQNIFCIGVRQRINLRQVSQ